MKILTPGHRYVAQNFENPEQGQIIQFIEKTQGEGTALQTVNDGTTNEELLAILIDRLKFLAAKLPSRETSIATTKLEEGLHWLLSRTRTRLAAGVEGTNAPH